MIRVKIEAVSLYSTVVKVHPDGTGALKKCGPPAIGKSRGSWSTKDQMVTAHERCAIGPHSRQGKPGDAPEGRALWRSIPQLPMSCHLLMDCAYEGNETRQLALDLGFIPVVH